MLSQNGKVPAILLLLTIIVSAEGRIRHNVKIFGTTFPPDLVRQEGKPLTPCPNSHPYPFDGSTKCCRHGLKTEDTQCRSHALDQLLLESDDVTCCQHDDAVNCPLGRCKESFGRGHYCPEEAPFPIENGRLCCSVKHRSANCSSGDTGTLLEVSDQGSCCSGQTRICKDLHNGPLICSDNPKSRYTTLCPDTHPFAVSNGDSCCAFNVRQECANFPNGTGEGLEKADNLDCCYERKSVQCYNTDGNPAICRTSLTTSITTTCPNDYPYAMSSGAFCCQFPTRGSDCPTGEIGSPLLPTDNIRCCLHNRFRQCVDPITQNPAFCSNSPNPTESRKNPFMLDSLQEDKVYSPNGLLWLTVQDDCNLVLFDLYNAGTFTLRSIWTMHMTVLSAGAGNASCKFWFDSSCYFKILDGMDVLLASEQIDCFSPSSGTAQLKVLDNGNIIVEDLNNAAAVVWESDTAIY